MCYSEPLLGAAVTSMIWARTKSVKVFFLMLMFCGGALFGVIDHLYNGELFSVPKQLTSDLILGAIITVSILALWGLLLLAAKINPTVGAYLKLDAKAK
jgi:hypothetical protein